MDERGNRPRRCRERLNSAIFHSTFEILVFLLFQAPQYTTETETALGEPGATPVLVDDGPELLDEAQPIVPEMEERRG